MPLKQNSGVSLIEILVALFTLSIGLLGLAAMQTKSLQFNQSAYLRTQATILASDIIDRARANSENLSAYEVDASGTGSDENCEQATSNCTPAQIASNDIFEWKNNVANQLPNGSASAAENGDIYAVTITWDDRDDVSRSFVMEASL